MWVSRKEFDEEGTRAVHRKTFLGKGVDVRRKAKEPLLYERHTINVESDTDRRRLWAIELGFERNGDCHWTTSQMDLRRKEQEYPSIMINYKLRCALHFSPICYHYYLV